MQKLRNLRPRTDLNGALESALKEQNLSLPDFRIFSSGIVDCVAIFCKTFANPGKLRNISRETCSS